MLNYVIFILTIAGIYAILAQSLMLSWGMGGIVNLGLAGFFAIGAYTSAMATKWGGLPIPVGMAMAMLAAAIAGLVVTFSTLRLRDDYLAIITLGFAEVLRIVANNEVRLTGGSDGISGIPGGLPRSSGMTYALVWLGIVTALALINFAALRRLATSPWGRALRAIRDDAVVAAVAGKRVSGPRLNFLAPLSLMSLDAGMPVRLRGPIPIRSANVLLSRRNTPVYFSKSVRRCEAMRPRYSTNWARGISHRQADSPCVRM